SDREDELREMIDRFRRRRVRVKYAGDLRWILRGAEAQRRCKQSPYNQYGDACRFTCHLASLVGTFHLLRTATAFGYATRRATVKHVPPDTNRLLWKRDEQGAFRKPNPDRANF